MRASARWWGLCLGVLGAAAMAACGSETSGTGGSGTTGTGGNGTTTGTMTTGTMTGTGGDMTTTGTNTTTGGNTGGGTSTGTMTGTGGGTTTGTGGGGGGYMSCGECTDISTGVPAKECKGPYDACQGDADCTALYNCAYFGAEVNGNAIGACDTSAAGACCVLDCFKQLALPQAAITKYLALDNCSYCGTCKALCDGTAEYCPEINAMGQNCPQR